MLSLSDVVCRPLPPAPWSAGDNIPWNDPQFSERMLAEHLTQSHDLASRRLATIDAQVDRLSKELPPPPARILDLACGPGLYLNRLCDLGYTGVGVDFSPASITHAQRTATAATYLLDDLRTADFGTGYDAALLLYGQINVFRRSEARDILARAFAALSPGGLIVIEPQTAKQVQTSGGADPSWSSHESGLFSDQPHVLLTESFWNEDARTSTQRFYVVDAGTGQVAQHALSNEAYTNDEFTELFESIGFVDVSHRESLDDEVVADGLSVITARRA